MVASLFNRVYAVYIEFLYNKKSKQKKNEMVEGKKQLLFFKRHPFELPNISLIAVSILNKSNLIMHLIILAQIG